MSHERVPGGELPTCGPAAWTRGQKAAGRTAPVSLGSTRHTTRETGGFRLTDAWFPAGLHIQPHQHERATFTVVVAGGFDLRFTAPSIRRSMLPCSAGIVFTEPIAEPHSDVILAAGARVVSIQPDALREDLQRGFHPLLGRISHFRNAEVSILARRLARELRNWDDLSPLAAEALALEMLVAAQRQNRVGRADDVVAPWMRRVDEFVHERYRERFGLEELAQSVGVDAARLSAAFREAYGVSIATYVRRLRVEWTAGMLREKDTPIATLALQAGFADQAHMTRVFKQETGSTPARFRRSTR